MPRGEAAAYTGTSWTGIMVASGIVSVRARIGGQEESASKSVEVTRRPWVDRIAEPQIKYFRCDPPLTAECPLPRTPEYFHDFGRFDPGPSQFPSTHTYISSGPNEGFGFFSGDESFLDIRDPWIELNGILRDPQASFWKGRGCDVERFHQETLAHERLHYQLLKEQIEAGITPGWLESAVAFGSQDEVRQALHELLIDFDVFLRMAGDTQHTSDGFKNMFHCSPPVSHELRNPRVPGRPRI